MSIIRCHQDSVFFSEAFFKKIESTSTDVKIVVSNLGFIRRNQKGHIVGEGVYFKNDCIVIFENVNKSVRTIAEYIGDPKSDDGFKPAVDIIDGPFVNIEGPLEKFGYEGVLENPKAWMDGEIEAQSFFIDADEEDVKMLEHNGIEIKRT